MNWFVWYILTMLILALMGFIHVHFLTTAYLMFAVAFTGGVVFCFYTVFTSILA